MAVTSEGIKTNAEIMCCLTATSHWRPSLIVASRSSQHRKLLKRHTMPQAHIDHPSAGIGLPRIELMALWN